MNSETSISVIESLKMCGQAQVVHDLAEHIGKKLAEAESLGK